MKLHIRYLVKTRGHGLQRTIPHDYTQTRTVRDIYTRRLVGVARTGTTSRELTDMKENENRGIARLSKHPRGEKVPMGRREQKQSRRYRRVRLPSKWWRDELAMESDDDHSAYTRVVGGLV